MRYTGSVNKVLWNFVIPTLFALFLFSRAYDFFNFDDGNRKKIADQLTRDVALAEVLDGVILGGSNARFGLSAKFFSEQTRSQWHNLSLLNEAFSDENYWQYIDSAIPSQEKRASVSIVVYSSLAPLRYSWIDDRVGVLHGLEGDNSFSLVPQRSFASKIKEFFLANALLDQNAAYPLPTLHGDFDFQRFNCRLDANGIVFERNLNRERIHQWINNQLTQLQKLFPNALIYFVVPSQYYGAKFQPAVSQQSDELLLDSVKSFNESYKRNVYFVRQPNFPSMEMLCNGMHHANEEGRLWRSKNLLDTITSVRSIS